MKKILFLFAFLTALLAAGAQENPMFISAGDLKHFQFGDNMKIVLVAVPPGQELSLGKEVSRKLQVFVEDGTMAVRHVSNLASNSTLYVLVNTVESITLGENTSLVSQGIIQANTLKVLVGPGAVARLQTTGKVNATGIGDYEVSVQTKQLANPSPDAAIVL